MSWQDLWLRKDQQAANALAENDPRKAAELFKSPQWQGAAEYRAGNFAEAVAAFDELDGDDDYYNLGNSLTRHGQLDEALKAYGKALQLNPEMVDASFNKELIEKLIQQQEQQKGQGENQDQKSGDQQQNQENGEESQKQQSDGQEQSQAQDQPDEEGEEQGERQDEAAPADEQKSEDPTKDEQQDQQGKKDAQAEESKERSAGQPEDEDDEEQPPTEKIRLPEDKMSAEEKQALEQWLRKIPDNPGGLLKRKFEYQSRQNKGRNPRKTKKIW